MCRKVLEAGLIAQKSMDVDNQERSLAARNGLDWPQGLSR